MADIYISSLDGRQVYQLPFIPKELPPVETVAGNETFTSFDNGSFTKLVKPDPASFTLEGVLPLKDYTFAKSHDSAQSIAALLRTAQANTEPVNVLIYRNDGTKYLNTLASVEKVATSEGVFMTYSFEFKEYRNYGNLQIASKLRKRKR